MAERLGRALQKLVHRFESGRDLKTHAFRVGFFVFHQPKHVFSSYPFVQKGWSRMQYLKKTEAELDLQRHELVRHPVFMGVRNIAGLRRMMEYHVFAQYDFAVLNHAVARQIQWHYAAGAKELFQAYRGVMEDTGADTRAIDTFETLKRSNVAHADALRHCGAPQAVINYSTFSSQISGLAELHLLLALMAYARDHRVHETFIRALVEAPKPLADILKPLDHFIPDYLAFPREELYCDAREVLREYCGNDPEMWVQVREYSQKAMRLRRRVWDGLLNELVMV